MNQIESYLSGTAEYDALSDAERCAICAAMDEDICLITEAQKEEVDELNDEAEVHRAFAERVQDYIILYCDYLRDGTAALSLVERFNLILSPRHRLGDGAIWWEAYYGGDPMDWQPADIDCATYPTTKAAIVAAVCALARTEWPY